LTDNGRVSAPQREPFDGASKSGIGIIKDFSAYAFWWERGRPEASHQSNEGRPPSVSVIRVADRPPAVRAFFRTSHPISVELAQ